MKIKVTFEPSDFDGGGQLVSRNGYSVDGCLDHVYKIGFTQIDRKPHIIMMCLSDGQSTIYPDMESLCHRLNSDRCGYTPICDEYFDAIKRNGNRFEHQPFHPKTTKL